MLVLSPLEQFQIIPLLSIPVFDNFFFGFFIPITNSLLISVITLISFSTIIYFLSLNKNSTDNRVSHSFFFIPNFWQIVVESVYDLIMQLIYDFLGNRGEKYFPFISVLFMYILFHNLIGMIPYSFTVTSHLSITFMLSFSTFVGINVICFKKHNVNMFSLFLPANTTFFLAIILVPIEFISYISKPISLGVRLFINLMAGHSLLKVLIGFSWSLVLWQQDFYFKTTVFTFPLSSIVLLTGLEVGVALIQTYVFITLVCIYLNEGEILH